MVLRDPAADMSLSVTCPRDLVLQRPGEAVRGHPGDHAAASRTSSQAAAHSRCGSAEIRAVGFGELLARIERLRKLLDAEGLFDPRLKRPIPFLPNTIGLITGRASAAERDVMTVATGRWPAVRFAVRNTVVQGPNAVPQIVEALRELDGDPAVDVIVVARGGGSVEDLLPFSDETLCRAISACTTPVVSAVGHEPDNPLCDLVADLRAATPTDAAKRIVPDTAAEQALRARSAPAQRTGAAQLGASRAARLGQLRSRPVLAQPLAALTSRADEIHRARTAARRDVTRLVAAESERVGHLSARLTTLGPAATLARGYAVVQTVPDAGEAAVLRTVADAPAGTRLRVRVSDGAVTAVSEGSQMKPISELGYEEARDELIEVVRQLEQGGLDLDASLKLWERGEELARRCDEHLAGARKRIEDALAAPDGDEATGEQFSWGVETGTRFIYARRHG